MTAEERDWETIKELMVTTKHGQNKHEHQKAHSIIRIHHHFISFQQSWFIGKLRRYANHCTVRYCDVDATFRAFLMTFNFNNQWTNPVERGWRSWRRIWPCHSKIIINLSKFIHTLTITDKNCTRTRNQTENGVMFTEHIRRTIQLSVLLIQRRRAAGLWDAARWVNSKCSLFWSEVRWS